jgi:hypothetical protein
MKNKPLVLSLSLLAILFVNNIALACGCGCKGNNCGSSQPSSLIDQKQIQQPEDKSQQLLMKNQESANEIPNKVDPNSKTYNLCCGKCK